jgi:hypothetical protein
LNRTEAAGNKHRRLELRKQEAAHPNSTFRNGSLSQDPIDVLVGLTRGTIRVAQKDICMEEMMVVT